LVKSRESKEGSVTSSSGEDTPCDSSGKIRENVEGGFSASNGWEVEGSSVRVGKVPLSLEETKVRVHIIVNCVYPIVRKRSFLSKCKTHAVCGNISSTR